MQKQSYDTEPTRMSFYPYSVYEAIIQNPNTFHHNLNMKQEKCDFFAHLYATFFTPGVSAVILEVIVSQRFQHFYRLADLEYCR